MKKIIIMLICIFLIVTISVFIFFKLFNKHKQYLSYSDVPIEKIEDLKNEVGATADANLYGISKEYDGREILVIKPDIQFRTVLAGILKNDKPSIEDVNNLDLNMFDKGGIWISQTSQKMFLEILKSNGIENFQIDDKGYLYMTKDTNNEYSKKIKSILDSKELKIIDITGRCYIRDEITGEIIEHPFKDMDIEQICEKFTIDNSQIIVVTTNEVDKLKILEQICN